MKLITGDCLVELKNLEDNSVDSIVSDPPYGISFMGKKWDYMGSGSTGIGAKLEGFEFIGIEREEEYCKIAEVRIDGCKIENKQDSLV